MIYRDTKIYIAGHLGIVGSAFWGALNYVVYKNTIQIFYGSNKTFISYNDF